jgi:phenylpropionate dioxygenase-like ring-hydroxylating dioxygenase large terminal subunit
MANLTVLNSSFTKGAQDEQLMPLNCIFSEQDWRSLASCWHPVTFSHEVIGSSGAVRLLDEGVVVYRLADGRVAATRDLCVHRGVPLSLGHVDGNEMSANTTAFTMAITGPSCWNAPQ